MGDRANIAIVQHDGVAHDDPPPAVYLYTHWMGHDLPLILQDALKRGEERWSDEQYLPRIIFCQMVRGDPDGLTSYGITNRMWDNNRPVIWVDCEQQQVWFEGSERKWTFREYVNAKISEDDPWEIT